MPMTRRFRFRFRFRFRQTESHAHRDTYNLGIHPVRGLTTMFGLDMKMKVRSRNRWFAVAEMKSHCGYAQ
jgi:hypothetical protein